MSQPKKVFESAGAALQCVKNIVLSLFSVLKFCSITVISSEQTVDVTCLRHTMAVNEVKLDVPISLELICFTKP